MISESSIRGAIALANLLEKNNSVIYSKQGTLFELVQRQLPVLMSVLEIDSEEILNGDYKEIISKIQTITKDEIVENTDLGSDSIIRSPINSILENFVPSITETMSSNLDYAVNSVYPIIYGATLKIQAALEKMRFGTSELNIIKTVYIPEFILDEETVQRYTEHAAFTPTTDIPTDFKHEGYYAIQTATGNGGGINKDLFESFVTNNKVPSLDLNNKLAFLNETINRLEIVCGGEVLNSGYGLEMNQEWAKRLLAIACNEMLFLHKVIRNERESGQFISSLTSDFTFLKERRIALHEGDVPFIYIYDDNVNKLVPTEKQRLFILGILLDQRPAMSFNTRNTTQEEDWLGLVNHWVSEMGNILLKPREVDKLNIFSAFKVGYSQQLVETPPLRLKTGNSYGEVLCSGEEFYFSREFRETEIYNTLNIFKEVLNTFRSREDITSASNILDELFKEVDSAEIMDYNHLRSNTHVVQLQITNFLFEQINFHKGD